MFAVLSAIDVSLFAWFVRSYKTEGTVILIFCFIGIVIVTFGILAINKKVSVLLKKLEEL